MHGVVLRSDAEPSAELLAAAIEDVVAASVGYFRSEWDAGRDPPCCLGCAEIRYVADEPGAFSEVVGARQVLKDGRASCQSAAAYYAARERAIAMSKGMSPEDARAGHHVVLQESYREGATDGYWHAVVQGPNGIEDVTEEMRR